MRKDVRLLMGVCAVLLILLIVYVLFVPGEKKGKPIAETTPAENSTGASNQTAPQALPTTEPVANINSSPIASPNTSPIATVQPSEPTVAITNAQPSAQSPASSTNWEQLLNTGQEGGAQVTRVVDISSMTPMNSTPETTATPAMPSTLTPASARAASAATGQRRYTVKLGDTLSSIAQTEFGNDRLYTKILAANPGLNPRQLHVGQQITIPDVHAASASATGEQASAAAVKGPHYTVQPGDSLQRISQKLYGTAGRWQKIYDMNRSRIGPSPARVRVGTVLLLPEAPTSSAR